MSRYPYRLAADIGAAGTLGLIVLQVDETIEQDFRRLLPDPEMALYITRIPSGATLSPETIAQMEHDLPRAAGLLPQAPRFDAVGYACTSGTALIGADRVAELVAGQVRTRHVTNPMTATLAALAHLGVRSVALVSPYTPAVAAGLQRTLEAGGIAVPRAISFGEEVEANVARIDPASIRAAAQEAATHPEVQAVFLSCTNLRTLDVIAPLERDLGIPVLGSNLALAWHMARLAGADQRLRYGCALTWAGGSNR